MFFYCLLLAVGTVSAALISPLIIKLYKVCRWDTPRENRLQKFKNTHRGKIPRGGGLVIFLSLVLGLLLFVPLDIRLQAILVSCTLLTVVGFFDDLYDLNPFLRLGTNILAAIIVVVAGVGIDFISNPFALGVIHFNSFLGGILPAVLAVIFIVAMINIVNWSKGVDGQMPGVVALAAIFIGILSLRFNDASQFGVSSLSFLTAGAFLGFLIWNFYPQKIMPGYGAGSLAGFLLAVLSIMSGAKVATVIMVLAVPTADAIFTILRRLKAGKSPFYGDRGHLHHKLLDKYGWGRRRVAIFYWLATLIMGMLTLILPTWGKISAIIIAGILTFTFLIATKFREHHHQTS